MYVCVVLIPKAPWTTLCLVHRKKQSLSLYLFLSKSHLPGGMLADLGPHSLQTVWRRHQLWGFIQCLPILKYKAFFCWFPFLLRPRQAGQSPPQSQLSHLCLNKPGGDGKREPWRDGLASPVAGSWGAALGNTETQKRGTSIYFISLHLLRLSMNLFTPFSWTLRRPEISPLQRHRDQHHLRQSNVSLVSKLQTYSSITASNQEFSGANSWFAP